MGAGAPRVEEIFAPFSSLSSFCETTYINCVEQHDDYDIYACLVFI